MSASVTDRGRITRNSQSVSTGGGTPVRIADNTDEGSGRGRGSCSCSTKASQALQLYSVGLRAPLLLPKAWPETKLHYWCTVISVPAGVVKPLYIAMVGWSPLASEGGTTTLN